MSACKSESEHYPRSKIKSAFAAFLGYTPILGIIGFAYKKGAFHALPELYNSVAGLTVAEVTATLTPYNVLSCIGLSSMMILNYSIASDNIKDFCQYLDMHLHLSVE